MSALTFDELRGTDNNITSLAYWVTLTRVWRFDDEERSQLANAMSYQYDVEEQSECSGWAELLVDDPRWRRRLRPIAPVQLAREWSPCPLASEILGAPFSSSVSTRGFLGREVVLIWHRRQTETVRRLTRWTSTDDERRFVELLGDACLLARKHRAGVLLVAQPGWSYENDFPIAEWIADSMRGRGYVRTDRKP